MTAKSPFELRTARRSTLGGFAAILLWSTSVALVRSLSEQVGPLTAAASVYLVGGLAVLVRRWWSGTAVGHFRDYPKKYLFGCGFLFVVYTALLFLAVGRAKDRDQVLEVGLVNYLWPALTLLFSLPLLQKKGGLLLLPGTLVALLGLFLVMTPGAQVAGSSLSAHVRDNPLAYGFALLAACCWALYSNLTRRWAGTGNPGAVEWFILATGILLLGVRLSTSEQGAWNFAALVEAVALGVITGLAYGLWDAAMRQGDLLLVAAVSYLTPLFSTIVSCVYLRVLPGSRLWIGCLLLVTGSLASWLSVSDRPVIDSGQSTEAGPLRK